MSIFKKFKKSVITEDVNNLHEINKSFIPKKDDFTFIKMKKIDGKELFDNTVRKLGWSDVDLDQRQNQYTIESRLGYGAALICLFLAAQNIAEYEYTIFISQALMTILFLLFGFTKSFRAWQVEVRAFRPFFQFLSNLEAWVR